MPETQPGERLEPVNRNSDMNMELSKTTLPFWKRWTWTRPLCDGVGGSDVGASVGLDRAPPRPAGLARLRLAGALVRWIEKAGPYLLLEILMPGGTLLALLLYLYQRKGMGGDGTEVSAVVAAFDALRAAYRRFAPSWLQL